MGAPGVGRCRSRRGEHRQRSGNRPRGPVGRRLRPRPRCRRRCRRICRRRLPRQHRSAHAPGFHPSRRLARAGPARRLHVVSPLRRSGDRHLPRSGCGVRGRRIARPHLPASARRHSSPRPGGSDSPQSRRGRARRIRRHRRRHRHLRRVLRGLPGRRRRRRLRALVVGARSRSGDLAHDPPHPRCDSCRRGRCARPRARRRPGLRDRQWRRQPVLITSIERNLDLLQIVTRWLAWRAGGRRASHHLRSRRRTP